MRLASGLTIVLFAGVALAHAEHDVESELAARREFILQSKADLGHCATELSASGIEQRAIRRRDEIAKRLAKNGKIQGTSPFTQISHGGA